MPRGIEGLIFENAIATGSAGDVQVVHDHANGFGHADGGDHKIGSAQTEGGKSNEKRCQHGDNAAAKEAEVRAISGMHQERSCVSAETEEHREPKRYLAGHAA